MKSIFRLTKMIAAIFIITHFFIHAHTAFCEEKANKTPIEYLPPEIREQATKAFNTGKKIYIWKDEGTKALVNSFMGQTMIVIGGISVLANPQSNEIAFSICTRFVYKDTATGKVQEIGFSTKSEKAEMNVASSKERRNATVVFGTDKGQLISGKGSFFVSLSERQNKKDDCSSVISNIEEIGIDLDKSEIFK